MRVMVSGSRAWDNPREVEAIVWQTLTALPGPVSLLIHGGAIGVDTMAHRWAKEWDIEEDIHLPDYNKYGYMKAPHVRNSEMLDLRPDLVVAFWDGASRGTRSVIAKAKDRNLQVQEVLL